MAGLSVTTKTRLLIQPFLLDFSFKCCHCFHTIDNSNPFSAVFMTLMLHFSQLSNTCSVHQNIVDLLLSQKNIGSLEMGTCFFRCIYFTIESGLVQTHVHQITNMVLATASFPRNAYSRRKPHFFPSNVFTYFLAIQQVPFDRFPFCSSYTVRNCSLRVLLRKPVVAHCW